MKKTVKEPNSTINTVKYPYETIENILKYMNETNWMNTDVLRIYGFLDNLRGILATTGEVSEEEIETDKNTQLSEDVVA